MTSSQLDLQYIDYCYDFENGTNKGPLSRKEVLVYSPPKSGTVAIAHGIATYKAKAGGRPRFESVLHNHSQHNLVPLLKLDKGVVGDIDISNRNIIQDLVSFRALHGDSTIVVSSYREPMARIISNAFQQIGQEVASNPGLLRHLDFHILNDRCTQFILDALNGKNHQLRGLEELEAGFYEENNFDPTEKCCHAVRPGYEILAVSLHHVDRWEEAFSKKLGFTNIKFPPRNLASDKAISGVYSEFKNMFRLDKRIIRELYFGSGETKYLRWFCTKYEIDGHYSSALEMYGRRQNRRLPINVRSRARISRLFSTPTHWIKKLRAKPSSIAEERMEAVILEQKVEYFADSPTGGTLVRVMASILNQGDESWGIRVSAADRVAVALRGTNRSGQRVTSEWHLVQDPVHPGDKLAVNFTTPIPDFPPVGEWFIDLIYIGKGWFSSLGLLKTESIIFH